MKSILEGGFVKFPPLLKNAILLLVLVILTIPLGTSCRSNGIKFDPDFYRADAATESIWSERGDQVACYETDFTKYSCMHEEKIKELTVILENARMPKDIKKEIIKSLKKALERPTSDGTR